MSVIHQATWGDGDREVSYLEVAGFHAAEDGVLGQFLGGDAGAGDAKGEAGEEAGVVADGGGGEDGGDFAVVDAGLAGVGGGGVGEGDWGFGEAVVAVGAALDGHDGVVGEVAG